MPPASGNAATSQQVQALTDQVSRFEDNMNIRLGVLLAKLNQVSDQVTALAAEVTRLGDQGTAAVESLAAEVDQLTP